MAVAAYLRVSSKAQDHATQRSAIVRASEARRDKISAWFSEKQSGKTLSRPELDRLRQAVREGRVQKLYVFRLDRLTRSGIRDTLEVVDELKRYGCELITITDGFDLQGPAAEVILSVMAWAAKMELLAKNERIAAARERLAREGKPWGRPSRLDEGQRDRIRSLKAAGRTIREIAVAVKVPRSTVARVLKAA